MHMLCKYIKGRLGNQMFQYATIRAFQQKYFLDEEIAFSFKKVEKKAQKENFTVIDSLKDFNTKYTKSNNIKIHFIQLFLIFKLSFILFIYKLIIRKNYAANRDRIEEKYRDKLLKNNIIWKTSGYTDFDISLIDRNKDILFYGYFESPKYFDEIKGILQKDFEPKNNIYEKNKRMYDKINKTNSICISIRRGDFVSNDKYSSEHYICDNKYFEEAISIMNEKVKNPQYVVFSDDVEWVKENMNFPDGTIYEDGNDPVWEKLRMMYSCKHFIISNSSFSWWAQYLSKNTKKVVIAPKIWNKKNDNRDIYESDWILI